MTRPRPDKVAEVTALEERLRSASVVILTDYRGLTVGELTALRSKLREASVDYRVTKNTLLSRAAERAGVPGLAPMLAGPTAVAFGRDDPGALARILQEFIRQYRKLEIKGGVVDGEVLGPEGIQALANLPSRPELLARVVGAIQAPLAGLLGVLAAPCRALVTALDALRQQREGVGEAGRSPEPVEGAGAPAAPAEA